MRRSLHPVSDLIRAADREIDEYQSKFPDNTVADETEAINRSLDNIQSGAFLKDERLKRIRNLSDHKSAASLILAKLGD